MIAKRLVELVEELGQEAGRVNDDERWARGVAPQKGRELVQVHVVEVVCDDGGELRRRTPPCLQCLRKQSSCFSSSVISDAVETLEKKVVASVAMGDGLVVGDGKVADAGQDEVLRMQWTPETTSTRAASSADWPLAA